MIEIGADADVVIWDPERQVTIRNDMLHHNVDYTPFENWQVQGWPVTTISRGEIVCDEGKVLGRTGYGRYLPRERYAHIEPTGVARPFDAKPV